MNTIRMIAVAVTILGLAGLLTPVMAKDTGYINGDTYAAIAYSPSTGKQGYAYNHGSRWSAERAALANCKAEDAKIVAWVNNGFCALALGEDRSAWGIGYSYGDGSSNVDARRALAECNKRTRNARIVLCVCSSDQFAPEVHQ